MALGSTKPVTEMRGPVRMTDDPTNRMTDDLTNRMTDDLTNRMTDDLTNIMCRLS